MTEYEKGPEKGRYLMLEDKGQVPAPYVEGTLLRCYIPGLLPVRRAYRNEQKLWLYDRRGRQSLFWYLENQKLQGEDILLFLKCLTECGMSVEEYLLPSNALWLKPELIFKDRKDEWRFLYYPGDSSRIEDLSFLMDRLMRYVNEYLLLSDTAEGDFVPMDGYAAEARAALNDVALFFGEMDRCINWEDLQKCVLGHLGHVHSIDPGGVHDLVHCAGENEDVYDAAEDDRMYCRNQASDGCRGYSRNQAAEDVQDKADRKERVRRWIRGFLITILITLMALSAMWLKCNI